MPGCRAGRCPPAWTQSDCADRSRRGDRCSRAHRRRRSADRRRGTRRRRHTQDAGRSAASADFDTSVIDVARLTATVVPPTPPFAPISANVLPAGALADGRATRRIAATRSSYTSGSAIHSLMPMRIASSSAAESSDRARITRPAFGNWRRIASDLRGAGAGSERMSMTIASGALPGAARCPRARPPRPATDARAAPTGPADRANRLPEHSTQTHLTNATLTTKLFPGTPPMPAFASAG